jgi:hypothetical protein
LIFFSNTQLNFGYRFQLTGDAQRISKTSWLVSLDRNFLNVWKAKTSKKGGIVNERIPPLGKW